MGDYYSHTSPHSYNYAISDIVVRINKEKLKNDMRENVGESAKAGLVLGNVREKGSDVDALVSRQVWKRYEEDSEN